MTVANKNQQIDKESEYLETERQELDQNQIELNPKAMLSSNDWVPNPTINKNNLVADDF